MTIKLKPKQAIIALDVDSLKEAEGFIDEIDKDLFRIKVGKQLFSSKGPRVVEELIAQGFDVFLDLKLHDIPNTVAKSLENISNLGVWMTNIHLLGGKENHVQFNKMESGRCIETNQTPSPRQPFKSG